MKAPDEKPVDMLLMTQAGTWPWVKCEIGACIEFACWWNHFEWHSWRYDSGTRDFDRFSYGLAAWPFGSEFDWGPYIKELFNAIALHHSDHMAGVCRAFKEAAK